jgi:hypothetical protein
MRAEKQFRDLFAAAGRQLGRIISTVAFDSIVEAVPAYRPGSLYTLALAPETGQGRPSRDMDGLRVYPELTTTRHLRGQCAPRTSATHRSMGGLFLGVYIVYMFRTFWRLANLLRSRRWSRETVVGSHLNQSRYNCVTCVSVDYEYAANGQKHSARFEKPFIFDSSAKP